MDTIFDVYVNISPFILIIGVYVLYKAWKEKEIYWSLLFLATFFLCAISALMSAEGHGNFYISVIMLIIDIVFLVGMQCFLFYKKMYSYVIGAIGSICFLLMLILKRIKYEEVKSIDEQTDILRILSVIIKNEYFKGISIGVISAVIAGLILERLKKKK